MQQAVDLMGGEITLETATETGIQTVLKMCDEVFCLISEISKDTMSKSNCPFLKIF